MVQAHHADVAFLWREGERRATRCGQRLTEQCMEACALSTRHVGHRRTSSICMLSRSEEIIFRTTVIISHRYANSVPVEAPPLAMAATASGSSLRISCSTSWLLQQQTKSQCLRSKYFNATTAHLATGSLPR